MKSMLFALVFTTSSIDFYYIQHGIFQIYLVFRNLKKHADCYMIGRS